MSEVKTPLEIPYSSYSFRRWLNGKNLKGRNKDFVERLNKDNMSPQSVGPRTPNVLIGYIMRMLDSPTSRVNYEVTDVNTIWSLWQLWVYERGDYDERSDEPLQPLRAEEGEYETN